MDYDMIFRLNMSLYTKYGKTDFIDLINKIQFVVFLVLGVL